MKHSIGSLLARIFRSIIQNTILRIIHVKGNFYIRPDGKDKFDVYVIDKFYNKLIRKEKEKLFDRLRQEATVELADKYFKNGFVVLSGPFKGLKYPSFAAYGSVLMPKLIGSYEAELHPCISEIIAMQYDDIIDIGCAEGYYAVGLAMKIPDSRIYAFDISTTAIEYCKKMAEVNLVQDRIIVAGRCDITNILSIRNPSRKQLIICDIEGGEFDLFLSVDPHQLTNFTLLIELHAKQGPYGLDCSLPEKLKYVYSKTHTVHHIMVERKDAKSYSYLQFLSPLKQELINADIRAFSLAGWIYMTPVK